MTIKRYNLAFHEMAGGFMQDHPEGEYVKWEEVEKLQAERDALAVQLAELAKQEPVAFWHHSGQVVTRDECHDDSIFKICCKVERTLYARAAPPAPFVVKLPKRYSIDAFDRLESDDDGFLFYSDAVVEAIKAAGGSVENDK